MNDFSFGLLDTTERYITRVSRKNVYLQFIYIYIYIISIVGEENDIEIEREWKILLLHHKPYRIFK